MTRVSEPPILVTGSHRSGTTWVGKMLCAAPRVGYIYEPFNIVTRISGNPLPVKYWYHHITEDESDDMESAFRRILDFKYPLLMNIRRVRSARNVTKLAQNTALSAWYSLAGYRPLLKDPLALFSAEWIHEHFDARVLVLTRHPAAFYSSLKLMNWSFDFNHFLRQPVLIERYLQPYVGEISDYARKPRSLLDQSVLLWNCIHHTVATYRTDYPRWCFARHEDISLNPLAEFESLYGKLDLEFTPSAKGAIAASSGAHNPSEQDRQRPTVRDSRANIRNWRNRLSEDEIQSVRSGTWQVAERFYTEQDW